MILTKRLSALEATVTLLVYSQQTVFQFTPSVIPVEWTNGDWLLGSG